MNYFKERLVLILYKYFTKFMLYGKKIETDYNLKTVDSIDPSVKVFPEAIIDNLSNNPTLIKVGANSIIRGQLLIFAHAGEIEIGKDCYLGEGSRIWSATSIRIGDRVLISHGVNIHDTNSHPIDSNLRHQHFMEIMSIGHPKINPGMVAKPIVIEDDVWIGFNSVILKGVKIGKKSIVGAGSVVTKDVPSSCVVAGNPAKVIYTL